MKKSIIALILVLTTLFTLVACSSKGTSMEMNDGGNFDTLGNLYPSMNGDEAETGESAEENATEIPAEDYGKFIENSFISTEVENVSTFAADVDTASYSYFRRLVNAGYDIDELIATAGNSIRTEEMINYFDYGY